MSKASKGLEALVEAAKKFKAVKLEILLSERVAILRMDHLRVNFLDRVSMKEVNETMTLLNDADEIRGLVLASASPTVFSAGLNLFEMYKPTPQALTEFWGNFQQSCILANTSRFFIASAISGTAPAGGCALSMWCDYRVMVNRSDVTIGLNETDFGLRIPDFVVQSAVNTVGPKAAQRMVVLGELFDPQTALRLGLVDELVETTDDLEADNALAIQTARKKLSALVAGSDARFECKLDTKLSFTSKIAGWLESRRDQDMKAFHDIVLSPDTQNALGAYIDKLKNKTKRAAPQS